jgi:hypothetical protein
VLHAIGLFCVIPVAACLSCERTLFLWHAGWWHGLCGCLIAPTTCDCIVAIPCPHPNHAECGNQQCEVGEACIFANCTRGTQCFADCPINLAAERCPVLETKV